MHVCLRFISCIKCKSLAPCVCFLYPSRQGFIDLHGPVGPVLTTDKATREPAISQPQPAHYPPAHDNSCLVPAQGLGCSCTPYVMTRRRGGGGGEQSGEGFYWDVSQYIMVCRANRLPGTRSGWGLLFTDSSISVWLAGVPWWATQQKMLKYHTWYMSHITLIPTIFCREKL